MLVQIAASRFKHATAAESPFGLLPKQDKKAFYEAGLAGDLFPSSELIAQCDHRHAMS